MLRLLLRIKDKLKALFDRIGNERLKQNLLQAIPFWVASLVTGLIAVFYAWTFAQAERLSSIIYDFHAWLLFVVSPLCFVGAWWIVKKYAPYARGSGIPQVMAAVELSTPIHHDKVKQLLSWRIVLVKILSSFVMVIGGGAVGREDPTIQIAGSVFRKVYEYLPDWWPRISKKNMIMTGAAAGLAAAFNTPLGGIVFAMEELTKMHISYFRAAIFTAVIIAGLTAQSFLGSYLYIGFPTTEGLSKFIMLTVILVAVVAGLIGSSMARIMWLIQVWKNKFKNNFQHVSYLLVCSLIIATIAYFINADVMGSGKHLMTSTLFGDEKHLPWYMPILRTLGPILSFTSGASGGVFAPALSGGASVGSVLSGWMQLSDSDTNLVILSGMVAFLTGVTRAPFTCAILVLEMTDRNNLILHLMLAGIVASFVAVLIDRRSLYDHIKHLYLKQILEEERAETH